MFTVADRSIGVEHEPYIIAELSANHNGSLERALESIVVAARSGADAIKIQTYTADTMTLNIDKSDFLIKGGLWDGYKLYDLYKEAETPYEWHKEIFNLADKENITIFSTPFDESAVDLLESLNAPAYKIASFEITDLPLIKYVASTGKPMFISTGMANENEIEEAVSTAKSNGCKSLLLFHCISSYPAPINEANLYRILKLKDIYEVNVGLSDHTIGNLAACAAISLGACAIEKHFTISRKDKGPDSEFSMEPDELNELKKDTTKVWSALGKRTLENQVSEKENIKFRRSIYFVKNLKAGEIITEECIRRIRPGFGLLPKHYDSVIGKKVTKNVEIGLPVSWDLLE